MASTRSRLTDTIATVAMRLSDISGEDIAKAEFSLDKGFENFVRELLSHEEADRHHPSAEIDGPMKRYRGDGQRDLVFVVTKPPNTARDDYAKALTWDALGETWYSCKGGPNWSRTIKEELGNVAYRSSLKDGTLPSPKVKQPSPELLEHLAGGGRYVFVISQQTVGTGALLDEIAELLRFWLTHSRFEAPERLRDQLALFDANRLADFIKRHKPTLSTAVVAALGVREPEAIMSFDGWARQITPGRAPPEFEPDAQRDEIIAALRGEAGPRIKRVHGAPGMGKTRTVFEAVSQDETRDRVRYTDKPNELLGQLERYLPGAQRLTLVVDEVQSYQVAGFVETFTAHATEDSRMVLMGTSDAEANHDLGGRIQSLELSKLSDHATRTLVEHEFERAGEVPDARVDTVVKLSEGFPLFAVKLAEALARDGDALATGTDDGEQWFAAQKVLVGPRAGVDNWAESAEIRGRCLLVVLLTNGWPMEWEQLWELHGDALALAVDRGADDLRRAAATCRERELLREVTGTRHRYVSPANLARMILNYYLGGPPDLGPRIVRYTPDYRARLFALGQELKVRPEALRRLASAEWQELERLLDLRDLEGLEGLLLSMGTVRACEEDPHGAARVGAKLVHALVDQFSQRALRVLAEMLVHATRRKLDPETFATAQRALSILVRRYDGDYAREAWTALFLIALSPTHEPWKRRLELLAGHARSPDPAERLLVAQELSDLLDDERAGPNYDDADTRDGHWPTPTNAEYQAGKSSLWSLALELAADPDDAVAQTAREATAKCFAQPTLPLEIVEALVSRVDAWLPQQRQPLLESVRWIRSEHGEKLIPRATEAFARLAEALDPVNLADRMVTHLMYTWLAPPFNIEAEIERRATLDRELAVELLHAPGDTRDPLLEWLHTPQAVRSRDFMIELGRVDTARAMLATLEADARTHADDRLLAGYLIGWGHPDPASADEWLANNLVTFTGAVIAALAEGRPTEQRFALLLTLIEGGHLDTERMRLFAERIGWVTNVDVERVLGMLTKLREHGCAPTSGLTMTQRLLAQPLTDSQRTRALDLLEGFLGDSTARRIPMIAQLDWQQGALELANAGRAELVTEHVLSLLAAQSGNLGLAERVLQELLAAGHGRTLWSRLRNAMLEPTHAEIGYHLARVGLLRRLDANEVLDWIGIDEHRARIVARLTNPYTDTLDPIVEALLRRFGSDSGVAAQLRKRARSSPLASAPLEFERRQLAHAQTWSEATKAEEVQAWARALAQELRHEIEQQEFHESLRRKYA